MEPKYKRVLLKLSGESLAGSGKHGIDFDTVLSICEPIKKCVEMGVEVAVVVGGGNFWRGRSSGKMDRTRADHMGMLATTINALGVADALEQLDVPVRVQTAISMQEIAEPYIRNRAVRHLEKGRVVVFGCGTGNPFFSTDTAAALRAAEIDADIIMKATMVDGVYDLSLIHIFRSDGSPRFAMVSTLAGALVNIILDPIFIFGFSWGMMGAAVATVLGPVSYTHLPACRI